MPPAKIIQLRILETTDLHSNVMDYDYYRDEPISRYGLVRTASLIRQARSEVLNTVLFDNGDLIQGSPMGDYCKSVFTKAGTTEIGALSIHPIYKVMNTLNYDAATLGNHEFNFGLPFLESILQGAEFPYVCTNITLEKSSAITPLVPKTLIINKKVLDEQGRSHCLRIGVLGVVPPQILTWDKVNLGQLHQSAGFKAIAVEDIVTCIQHYANLLKNKEHVDLVIVLSHSGYSVKVGEPCRHNAENCANFLANIPEVDVILSGHAHAMFPPKDMRGSYDFETLQHTNFEKGLIHGKPTTMPGFWGDHLGVIDLKLVNIENKWQVQQAEAAIRPIFDVMQDVPLVSGEADLRALIHADHEKTREFVNQPIGKNKTPMFSYLALIQDDPTIQIIAAAQKAYGYRFLEAHPEYAHYPVLSAAAPFKSGGRKNDPMSYVEIDAGELCYRHSVDIYSFPNTVAALKITGEQIKEWLECSASMFNQIDPDNTAPQYLVNWEGFRTYNFDIIDGIEYEIDLTELPKYDRDCELINPLANRIKELKFLGKPIDENAFFILMTNNYRAYGGKFSGAEIKNIILSSTDELPDVIARYIGEVTKTKGYIDIKTQANWRFSPLNSVKELEIRFETANSPQAESYIAANSRYPLHKIGIDAQGFAVYRINLN